MPSHRKPSQTTANNSQPPPPSHGGHRPGSGRTPTRSIIPTTKVTLELHHELLDAWDDHCEQHGISRPKSIARMVNYVPRSLAITLLAGDKSAVLIRLRGQPLKLWKLALEAEQAKPRPRKLLCRRLQAHINQSTTQSAKP